MSVWQNYRFGTNEALKIFERDGQAQIITHIVDLIENELEKYTSTEKDIRQPQLRSFVTGCMDFKAKFNEQQCIYHFHRSKTSQPFDMNRMAAADGAFYPGADVELSLWPALLKETPLGDSLCLEPKLILLAVSEKRD
jgi:hypothetical protein